MHSEHNTLSNFFIVSFTVAICICVVIFEATQQFYYVKLYNLGENPQYIDFVTSQSRKFLVWVIYAIPLWFFIKRLAYKEAIGPADIYKTLGFILGLLFLVILTMAIIELSINSVPFSWQEVWANYFVFYLFQKVPMYSFGYTFLSIVFYLYSKNNQLTIEVLKFSQLNRKDLQQYYQQQAQQDTNTSVLKIKVGNKYKIISIDDIDWIEADNYCANIHSQNETAVYSMRATLKSLEQQLPEQFMRVHRSAIVNLNSIGEYQTKGSGPGTIRMKNGAQVSVAQSKLKQLNAYFSVGESRPSAH